ncbi:MAG: ATP synthase F1 subunit gamma [Niameybacter sp.]|uniref:ATP synthase F1 subunit gamma n=1 Tax=Niameybacter sp. TaxID=2033640 RepID=UPI002FC8587A
MASLQAIKGRIKSVSSTKQITNAMNLVATSKLTKAKEAALKSRPFFTEVQKVIQSIAKNSANLNSPLLKQNGSSAKGYVVLAGDKGLAGGYNANIGKLVMNHITNKDEARLITVGKKSREFFKARHFDITKEISGISAAPTYSDAREIASYVIDLFNKGEVGEVYFAYTAFKSTIQQEPTLIRLLPVDISQIEEVEHEGPKDLLIYEPSPEAVLDYLMPRYVTDVIYGGLVESNASEQGARMTAMDSATENANEMIEKLAIESNRARQAAITQELSEIVGGAAALK